MLQFLVVMDYEFLFLFMCRSVLAIHCSKGELFLGSDEGCGALVCLVFL